MKNVRPCSIAICNRLTRRARLSEGTYWTLLDNTLQMKSEAISFKSPHCRKAFQMLPTRLRVQTPYGSHTVPWRRRHQRAYDSPEWSLESGVTPNDWLDIRLAALPKPANDHTKIGAYRIITMQNCICKLLEKSAGRCVAQGLEDEECLPSTLGSYRRWKDTWMNISVLASDIYDGFKREETFGGSARPRRCLQ